VNVCTTEVNVKEVPTSIIVNIVFLVCPMFNSISFSFTTLAAPCVEVTSVTLTIATANTSSIVTTARAKLSADKGKNNKEESD